MDTVLVPLKLRTCLVYMDDILGIFTQLRRTYYPTASVLQALSDASLMLNPLKWSCVSPSAFYLCHKVCGEGVGPDPKKTEAILRFLSPCCATTVRHFIGMAANYCRFVIDFSKIAGPLFDLNKQGVPFKWESEQKAFANIRFYLSNSPILAHIDLEAQLILRTDASLEGLWAVLSQKKNGVETVLHYLSKRLKEGERKWHPNDLECLAVKTLRGTLRRTFLWWEDPQLRRLIIRLSPPNIQQELSLFQVIKGILFKRNTKPGKQWLLVGPKRLHYDIIRACQADPVGGHEGVKNNCKIPGAILVEWSEGTFRVVHSRMHFLSKKESAQGTARWNVPSHPGTKQTHPAMGNRPRRPVAEVILW